jgi:N-methylhydantoinase A
MADERQDFIRTRLALLDEVDFKELVKIHAETVENAKRDLKLTDKVEFQIKLDLRYVGQEFTLSVPVDLKKIEAGDAAGIRKDFDELHEHRYAHHAADEAVEMVNYRLVALGRRPSFTLPKVTGSLDGSGKAPWRREVYFDSAETPVNAMVYDRASLKAGDTIEGPALVQEYASTTVMFAGDVCKVADTGELIISVKAGR